VVGVIPARWGSTRFPGKSLALVAGIPLVVRVYRRAQRARRLEALVVATDDERIRRAVEEGGGRAVMTSGGHPSGTDRVHEASGLLGSGVEIVVNIQGDEPLVDPALIDAVVEKLEAEPEWDMATAAAPIGEREEAARRDVVKVVMDARGGAMYFSRAVIPWRREDVPPERRNAGAYWRHIGLYAYRRGFLDRLVSTPPCMLEEMEKLEQLRALYIGGRIGVVCTRRAGPGVDRPEDVRVVEELIARGDGED